MQHCVLKFGSYQYAWIWNQIKFMQTLKVIYSGWFCLLNTFLSVLLNNITYATNNHFWFKNTVQPQPQPQPDVIRFVYSEKVTKFCKIFTSEIYRWRIILADTDFFQQSVSVSATDFRGRNNRPSAKHFFINLLAKHSQLQCQSMHMKFICTLWRCNSMFGWSYNAKKCT